MLEQNKAAVRRFYETIGAGDLSIIDELLAEDVVIHGVGPWDVANGCAGTRELAMLSRGEASGRVRNKSCLFTTRFFSAAQNGQKPDTPQTICG